MTKTLKVLTFVLLVVSFAAIAAAEHHEAPTVYVWISEVQAQPGKGEALVGLLMKDAAVYDPLVESGAVAEWGIAMPVVHSGGDSGLRYQWVTFVGWAGADQFMSAFGARMGAMSEEERMANDAEWRSIVEPGSHVDIITRGLHVGNPVDTPAAYLHLAYWSAKDGKGGAAKDFYMDYAAPVYDQLVADGKILNYGLLTPTIHHGEDWTHMGWYSSANLAARDAVSKAFEAKDSARSEEENKAFMEEVMGTYEADHEDQILLVVHHKVGGTSAE